MNNWKIAFWTLFVVTIGMIGFGCYLMLDQAVTLTYMWEGYKDTEADLKIYTQMIEQKKPHYRQIRRQLEKAGVDFVAKEDEGIIIGIKRTTMRFGADSLLTKIEMN
jgi:hypothetical protein